MSHADRWWVRELAGRDDPISLEPLRTLRYPPFELQADPQLPHGTDSDWFDGHVLASYLVSTGQFFHPISRREMRRNECQALDVYLRQHHLGKAQVTEAFDNREAYNNPEAMPPGSRAHSLRAEADMLLQSLFSASNDRRDERARYSRQRADGDAVRSDGNMVIFDDDQLPGYASTTVADSSSANHQPHTGSSASSLSQFDDLRPGASLGGGEHVVFGAELMPVATAPSRARVQRDGLGGGAAPPDALAALRASAFPGGAPPRVEVARPAPPMSFAPVAAPERPPQINGTEDFPSLRNERLPAPPAVEDAWEEPRGGRMVARFAAPDAYMRGRPAAWANAASRGHQQHPSSTQMLSRAHRPGGACSAPLTLVSRTPTFSAPAPATAACAPKKSKGQKKAAAKQRKAAAAAATAAGGGGEGGGEDVDEEEGDEGEGEELRGDAGAGSGADGETSTHNAAAATATARHPQSSVPARCPPPPSLPSPAQAAGGSSSSLVAAVGGGSGGATVWSALPRAPADMGETRERNKQLIATLQRRLIGGGLPDAEAAQLVQSFKQSSSEFIKGGGAGAKDYLDAFLELFGAEGSAPLLLELAVLLPSAAVRAAFCAALQCMWGLGGAQSPSDLGRVPTPSAAAASDARALASTGGASACTASTSSAPTLTARAPAAASLPTHLRPSPAPAPAVRAVPPPASAAAPVPALATNWGGGGGGSGGGGGGSSGRWGAEHANALAYTPSASASAATWVVPKPSMRAAPKATVKVAGAGATPKPKASKAKEAVPAPAPAPAPATSADISSALFGNLAAVSASTATALAAAELSSSAAAAKAAAGYTSKQQPKTKGRR